MSKIITYSNWSAINVPSGISFDTSSGIFSGTPNAETGEYTIPVSVQTNYGSDSKDVTILVEGKSYSVYAIGYNAPTWSNATEPDENGLYPVDIPNAYKLQPHMYGFSAYSSGGNLYDCGANSLSGTTTNLNAISVKTSPVLLSGTRSLSTIFHQAMSPYSGSGNNNLKCEFYVLLKYTDNNNLTAETSARSYVNGTTSPKSVYSKLLDNKILDNSNGIKLPEHAMCPAGSHSFNGRLKWLSNNGYSVGKLIFDQPSGSSTTIKYNIEFEDLGTRAFKIFYSEFYSYLTESSISGDKTLDDTSSNFTLGKIKNAWFFHKNGYVLTENNDLHEKDISGDWIHLGNWPVKKIEFMPSGFSTYIGTALMLTDNGELFHKGIALNGICEAHDSFTRILDNSSIIDMTICYSKGGSIPNNSTLIVLKE